MVDIISQAERPATAETGLVTGPYAGPPLPAGPHMEPSGVAEYARVLWRRRWVIVVTFAVAVVAALAYCVSATKTYSATATVLLEPVISQDLVQSQNPDAATSSVVNVQDVIQIMESSSIAELVAKSIPHPPPISAAEVGTLATTDIVELTASSPKPHVAAAAANAYANAYIYFEQDLTKSTFESAEAQLQSKADTLEQSIGALSAQMRSAPAGSNQTTDEVQLGDLENQLSALQNQQQNYEFYATQGTSTEVGRVISAATVPTKQSSPKTAEYVVLAAIFGLIAGVGLALLVNAVSSRRL